MCDKCNFQSLQDRIDDMICLPEYQWAIEPIGRIYEEVGTAKHVEPGQRNAIRNIEIMSRGKK